MGVLRPAAFPDRRRSPPLGRQETRQVCRSGSFGLPRHGQQAPASEGAGSIAGSGFRHVKRSRPRQPDRKRKARNIEEKNWKKKKLKKKERMKKRAKLGRREGKKE